MSIGFMWAISTGRNKGLMSFAKETGGILYLLLTLTSLDLPKEHNNAELLLPFANLLFLPCENAECIILEAAK
jgi:hypothetical protein